MITKPAWRSILSTGLLIGCSVALGRQSLSATRLEAEPQPPGLVSPELGVVVVTLRPGVFWLGNAIDELAVRYGRILVRCGLPDEVGGTKTNELSGRSFRVPDDLNAMRQIAALSGSEIVELSPEILLMRSIKGHCEEPLLITAEPVSGLGVPLDPGIDAHALEVKLFQTVGSRTAGVYGLFGVHRDGILYWAAHDGQGRELYVLSQSTDDLSDRYPTVRRLDKVAIDGTGNSLAVQRLWSTNCGGPVAQLELDFDRDGVVDVVCFSGRPGTFDGATPLVVVSGATGKPIGEIAGQEEVVITDLPTGYRIRTTGRIDDTERHVTVPIARSYVVTAGLIGLASERRAEASKNWMGQMLAANAASLDSGTSGQVEHVVAHFVIYPNGHPYQGIPRLGRIGDRVPRRGEDGRYPPTVHVLLDYRPAR